MHSSSIRTCRLAFLLAPVVLLLRPETLEAQVQQGGKGGGGFPAPLPDLATTQHVLERLTFGATRSDTAGLRERGVRGWLLEQLDPLSIPESPELLDRLAALPPATTPRGDPQWVWSDLYADDFLRKRYSTRQLDEVMAEFWSNHFNTSLDPARAGRTGYFASLARDATGNPIVCGYDANNTKPRCNFWNGSGWLPGDADPEHPSGWYLSLAMNPVSGKPAIASYEPRFGNGRGYLRYSAFDGSAWQPELVDTSADVGSWSSLRFDAQGKAFIAYYDQTNAALKLAWRDTGGWTASTVEAGGVGRFASLALDRSGRPWIAYLDATGQRLRLAHFDGATWSFHDIAALPLAGFDLDQEPWTPRLLRLEIDPVSDAPCIAFHDVPARRLRFARFDGVSATLETVDDPGPSGDVGLHPSLAFDPLTGAPAIAYFDRANFHLKLARRGASTWTRETVDASNVISGEWCSLSFDAQGKPSIAGYNGSYFLLELFQWTGSQWVRQTVEHLSRFQYIYAGYERVEGEAFRALAFGRFRDILEASATSAGMMVYLNNNQNVAGLGNENYARELLELHTVGVDGGYDQTDVETLARALTGWGAVVTSSRCDVQKGDFCYNHLAHDGRARSVMGIALPDDSANVPGNWMKQGEAMLDALACHPATARFLCRKLIEKFVSDDVPDALQARCVGTWLASDGDIREVLESILLGPEFVDPANFENKVKTPVEWTLSALRNLEAETDGSDLAETVEVQGAERFRVAPPTGYAERGDWWINSNTFLQRWKFADQLAHSTSGSTIDPVGLVQPLGLDRADAVVEYLLTTLVRGEAGAAERDELLSCLSGGDPGFIDLTLPQNEARLRDTVEMVLGFPGFHKQ